MSIKKIRNYRGMAIDLADTFGGTPAQYLKSFMKKAKVEIKKYGITK